MTSGDSVIYRAGAYLRLSLSDDDKGMDESISIKNQRFLIQEYAKEHDIEILEYYVDDGYSGGNFNRPGFKKLIEDIESGYINCVITKDTSRLGREFIETGNYMFKYFPEHNVRYISILENYDTNNPNGIEDIIPFKTVINDMYLKDISKKIKSVRHNMMAMGLYVGSTVPYGYKRSIDNSKKLIVDVYAATIIKKIFNMAEAGITPVMIARKLTDMGIVPPNVYSKRKLNRTFTVNIWKSCTVRKILSNEVYLGMLVQGKYERVSLKSKKKRLLPKNKWIIVKKCHEPIIERKQFDIVNKMLLRQVKREIRVRKYDYLLKGLVVCDDCNRSMLVRRVKSVGKKKNSGIRVIYCCRTYAQYRNKLCSMHYFREDLLNEIVKRKIKDILSWYIDKEKLINKYNSIFLKNKIFKSELDELNKLNDKLHDIDLAICELYDDKDNEKIVEEEFKSLKNGFEKERIAIIKNISKLKSNIEMIKCNINCSKWMLEIIDDFLNVEGFDKQLFNELIDKITIDERKNVKIYLKFKILKETYGRK